jgi:hypothetical protein
MKLIMRRTGVRGRRGRQRAAAVAMGAQRVERPRANGRFVVGSEAPIDVAHHGCARADGSVEHARVAGQVDERHHERRNARVLERPGEERVVFGDGRFGGPANHDPEAYRMRPPSTTRVAPRL